MDFPVSKEGFERKMMKKEGIKRHDFKEMAVYAANDKTHLYVMVDFTSYRLFRLAKEFGFTFYINGGDSFRRSFGITYPSGIYIQLQNYPGAQTAFLGDPNWINNPDHQAIVEASEANSLQNALIIQRENRREMIRPIPISLLQLEAQNLILKMNEDEGIGLIFFKIPLKTGPTTQFSPDIRINEPVSAGFEIHPVRLFGKEMARSAPLITSERADGRVQPQQVDEQKQRETYQMMQRVREPLEAWIIIDLSDSDD